MKSSKGGPGMLLDMLCFRDLELVPVPKLGWVALPHSRIDRTRRCVVPMQKMLVGTKEWMEREVNERLMAGWKVVPNTTVMISRDVTDFKTQRQRSIVDLCVVLEIDDDGWESVAAHEEEEERRLRDRDRGDGAGRTARVSDRMPRRWDGRERHGDDRRR